MISQSSSLWTDFWANLHVWNWWIFIYQLEWLLFQPGTQLLAFKCTDSNLKKQMHAFNRNMIWLSHREFVRSSGPHNLQHRCTNTKTFTWQRQQRLQWKSDHASVWLHVQAHTHTTVGDRCVWAKLSNTENNLTNLTSVYLCMHILIFISSLLWLRKKNNVKNDAMSDYQSPTLKHKHTYPYTQSALWQTHITYTHGCIIDH